MPFESFPAGHARRRPRPRRRSRPAPMLRADQDQRLIGPARALSRPARSSPIHAAKKFGEFFEPSPKPSRARSPGSAPISAAIRENSSTQRLTNTSKSVSAVPFAEPRRRRRPGPARAAAISRQGAQFSTSSPSRGIRPATATWLSGSRPGCRRCSATLPPPATPGPAADDGRPAGHTSSTGLALLCL